MGMQNGMACLLCHLTYPQGSLEGWQVLAGGGTAPSSQPRQYFPPPLCLLFNAEATEATEPKESTPSP